MHTVKSRSKHRRMMTASTAEYRFGLPYLLSFEAGTGGRGKAAKLRPGRGEAGHAVVYFRTRADRDVFMREHPESRMRSWQRIERGEA